MSDGTAARPDQINANEITLYTEINGALDFDNLLAALINAANGFVKLNASADVPLAQIPDTLTGKDADTLDGSHLADVIPSGVIVMWAGTLATIPSGWSLCDGGGSTPDLRDKFIYGASAGVDPSDTGGALTHTHTYSDLPIHTHTLTPNPHVHNYHENYTGTIYGGESDPHGADEARNKDTDGTSLTIANAGDAGPTTDAGSTLPPYYKLAFIQKD